MLSITKINAASNKKTRTSDGKGYLHYLGSPSTRERGDFDDYARGKEDALGPPPFWACKGPALLGLDAIAEAEHVERLAMGRHPITGEPLVIGAGDRHVMGLDMTFSAPKDFSAVFAGADSLTKAALIECLQDSARSALSYAESATVTRHGVGGRVKQIAEAAVAACYTHFASRALDPQLHVHAFMFNVGKRKNSNEWSALEHRPQFDRKMATGILFRVELAAKLKGLGFGIEPTGPYFAIKGVTERQRAELSTRSKEISDRMKEQGLSNADGPAAKEVAALNSRAAKAEPPLPVLLRRFEEMARALGLDPASVSAMRQSSAQPEPEFSIDHAALLEDLMESQSCSTAQEALTRICERAMGRWNASECLQELGRFMQSEGVVRLGRTELLTEVFTSNATLDLERGISGLVEKGRKSTRHRVDQNLIDKEFDALEASLRKKLGVVVSLAQQRAAAVHIASGTGQHAFVEGWAGTGKTTMLTAVGKAYRRAGFKVMGCCQSAAASQNLARETGISSGTIASLLLAVQNGKTKLTAKTILILDEAGMVGSREFGLLQKAIVDAGGKMVCVGDPKQLQPIDAGGISASLMRLHGKAEISSIQRQRTDFEPLLDWLTANARGSAAITKERAKALRSMPEDARLTAMENLCASDAKLSEAFSRWRGRYDFEWMREAVEMFAKGNATDALALLDSKGRLKLMSNQAATMEGLISAWDIDKTPIKDKTIIAATRVEVAALNLMARQRLISKGLIDDRQGVDVDIIHRDDTTDRKRFAPGDRIVFTKNDRNLGVVNGAVGAIRKVGRVGGAMSFEVELDDANEIGERVVLIPASFGRFDTSLCLTNHKSQGRTYDSAYVLANPSMADREWTYVAASRSRFATNLFVNASALGLVDPESHQDEDRVPKERSAALDALASRMKKSRAKGTSLDYDAPYISPADKSESKRLPSLKVMAHRFANIFAPTQSLTHH